MVSITLKLRRYQTGSFILHVVLILYPMLLHMIIKTISLAEMLLLPETAPKVHALFDSGTHVVRRSSSGSFNNVCTDLDLQQSVAKDSKSRKAGIIGISRQESVTLKWYLTVHVCSTITRNFKSFSQLNDVEEPIHRSLAKSMNTKDEQDIQSIKYNIAGCPECVIYSFKQVLPRNI